jgi:[ribosomal protein S18]-alanine N-acetyltransferase
MAAPDELAACFRVMSQADAVEISGWHYQPPYDFYDATADAGDLAELLDPELRAGNYLAAVDRGGAVVGFAQLLAESGTVDVGWACGPT